MILNINKGAQFGKEAAAVQQHTCKYTRVTLSAMRR